MDFLPLIRSFLEARETLDASQLAYEAARTLSDIEATEAALTRAEWVEAQTVLKLQAAFLAATTLKKVTA